MLAYQLALDTANEGNFNLMNPEEAVRHIKNLASTNSTKNTDFERNVLAITLRNEQLDDVKPKLDSVHKLLKKQVSFAEDVETIDVNSDKNDEGDVNFIRGLGIREDK